MQKTTLDKNAKKFSVSCHTNILDICTNVQTGTLVKDITTGPSYFLDAGEERLQHSTDVKYPPMESASKRHNALLKTAHFHLLDVKLIELSEILTKFYIFFWLRGGHIEQCL